MRLNQILREYLAFNRQEQRGLLFLLILLSAVILAIYLTGKIHSSASFDYSAYQKEITGFEDELRRQDSLEAAAKKTEYRRFTGMFSRGVPDTAHSFPGYKKEVVWIELNAADTFDLQRLHGIGPSYARRIVGYRKRLGGFTDKSQLLEIPGMDPALYRKIASCLTVNPDSVHPMDLNRATFKELMSHPYFSYGMAKAIMLYRKEHKTFREVSEILSISGINDSVYRKLLPYIRVQPP
ncbi:MAG TPA: helix-hairpin-helix domain-containing protein [Bacteroidales bacterium]|nr:helix-hairpin-helix domain-containing protein [Bacteroidales bacterium]